MGTGVSRFVTTGTIHHGVGALGVLASELARRGVHRAGLITDPGIAQAGLLERVTAAAQAEITVLAEAEPEPRATTADRCAAWLRDEGCDLVIALGGGSALDTAKMAALMARNDGDTADYFGVDLVPLPGLPVIALPTTAGTGSEVSPAAVFRAPDGEAKVGVRSDYMLPQVAILDPTLTVGLPPELTATTGLDALTHAIEAYTSPRATIVSDMVAERAIDLIGRNLGRAYGKGDDLEARQGMLMGSLLAGMALAVAGVGAVHALAHVMGAMHGVQHGLANALLLPKVMAYNRVACAERYARLAALLGEPVAGLSVAAAAEASIAAVTRLAHDVGIPPTLQAVGVPESGLAAVAERAVATQARVIATNPRGMNEEQAEAVLRAAYEG